MAASSVSACQWLPFSFSLSMISGSSYISAYQQLFLSLSLSMAPHLSQSIKVSSLSWVAPLPRPISGSSFILALTLLYNFSVTPPLSGPISPSVVPPLSAYQGLFLILGGSFTPAYQWLFLYLSADSSVQLLSGSSPIWAYQPLSGSSIISLSRSLPYLGWLLYPGVSVALLLS